MLGEVVLHYKNQKPLLIFDLTTSRPEYAFHGLRAGDSLCLCAPKVKLESAHVHVFD